MLPAQNVSTTFEFYKTLGFQLRGLSESPNAYAIVCRDDIELHFFEYLALSVEDCYAGCYIRVESADNLYQEFRQKDFAETGVPRIGRIENKVWGMREFYLIDINGNLLRFGHDLSKSRL